MSDRGDLHLHVDAIQEGTREFALIAGDLIGGAAAGALGVAKVAARTGVHGGDELKTSRELSPLCCPDDGDVACLQRLSQSFQRIAGKFRQFIEKKNAVVG